MTHTIGFTEASVEDFVKKLSTNNPAKTTFSLAEIFEAMFPDVSAAAKADSSIVVPQLESLNNVLKKLGHEGKLTVTTEPDNNDKECAIVTFSTLG